MSKKVGSPVRGSTTGRPVMVLFDVLGRRWTMRILWELRDGPLTFRALQDQCEQVSPTLLNGRLKDLRKLNLVDQGDDGYVLTKWGAELGKQLAHLDQWSEKWAAELPMTRE